MSKNFGDFQLGVETYRYTQSGSASKAFRLIDSKSNGYRELTPFTASA